MRENLKKVCVCFIMVSIIVIGYFVFMTNNNLNDNRAKTSEASFNPIARQFGGTITIDLKENKKLVNISWKADDSLWILTREMRKDEDPEIYEYHEDSTFGVIEGTVIIIEHKTGKKYSDK